MVASVSNPGLSVYPADNSGLREQQLSMCESGMLFCGGSLDLMGQQGDRRPGVPLADLSL